MEDREVQAMWSNEAEQGVLGACLLDPRCVPDILSALMVDDFYHTKHAEIYRGITELDARRIPLDVITLGDEIKRLGFLRDPTIPAYLAELIALVPSAANVGQYVKTVRACRQRRRVMEVGQALIDAAKFSPSVERALDTAEQQIYAVQRGPTQSGFVSIATALTQAMKELDRTRASPGTKGIPTGFDALDALIGGFDRGDLVIVAARPSMGKTALALQFGMAASRAQYGTALVSLEMTTPQLVLRMLAADGKIETGRMKSGYLTHSDWHIIAAKSGELEVLPIAINDSPEQTVSVMRSQLRQLSSRMPLGMIIVDYLQLIPESGGEHNREREISSITRSLKLLAKEMHVCVVALSQLNRRCEERMDKRPLASDLRESGSIEQDADMIFMLYRDEVYNQPSDHPGIAEVIVRKNRNGPTGSVELTWANQWTRFADLEG